MFATNGSTPSASRANTASMSSIDSKPVPCEVGYRSVRVFNSPADCGPRNIMYCQQCQLVAVESEGIIENVAVLVGAAAAVHSCETLLAHEQHRVHHGPLAVVGHRFAVRLLVARIDERVRRERVLVRRCRLLLDQAAEHTKFFSGELHLITVTATDFLCWSQVVRGRL